MSTRNLTLKLPIEAVQKAKIVAARRGTSISALVTEKIQELVGEDAQYDAARRHALKRLDRGWRLGGGTPARADLHD